MRLARNQETRHRRNGRGAQRGAPRREWHQDEKDERCKPPQFTSYQPTHKERSKRKAAALCCGSQGSVQLRTASKRDTAVMPRQSAMLALSSASLLAVSKRNHQTAPRQKRTPPPREVKTRLRRGKGTVSDVHDLPSKYIPCT